ncbi:glycosyltransferase family 2 protein [Azospirillum sp. SYSU D00513]|uniref:glycosyltransferase family 2 protein n=1 Tax=Azospirillum sp. SYSU D00513 TaxID=2812561 RepID=UPI001A963057|nr:glycosyltransferase family 2 protein [Azospirillum sp. SYSU D00513]
MPDSQRKGRVCAFTISRNERHYLPKWESHYGGRLGFENIFVLDHRSDDGSTVNLRCRSISLQREEYCEVWKSQVVSEFQSRLLQDYEVVVYSDVDELLFPAPGGGGDLKALLLSVEEEVVAVTGYDLLHYREREPALDLSRPVTSQRSFWRRNWYLDKPLITRSPVQWSVGSHHLEGRPEAPPRRDDILMLHLHWADHEIAFEKLRFLRSILWSEQSVERGLASHNRFSDEQLERVYAEDIDNAVGRLLSGRPAEPPPELSQASPIGPVEHIPAAVRGSV